MAGCQCNDSQRWGGSMWYLFCAWKAFCGAWLLNVMDHDWSRSKWNTPCLPVTFYLQPRPCPINEEWRGPRVYSAYVLLDITSLRVISHCWSPPIHLQSLAEMSQNCWNVCLFLSRFFPTGFKPHQVGCLCLDCFLTEKLPRFSHFILITILMFVNEERKSLEMAD